MRLLFLGSPHFACAPLEALHQSEEFEVAAVITKPDKPAGRGHKLSPTPTKTKALELGIPVFEPPSLKKLSFSNGEFSGIPLADKLNSLGPIDGSVVVAYGKIVPKALLELGQAGAINIHPSLLPRWRGAAPIQWAVFSGDEETGVSLMKLDEGLDTGPVFVQKTISISEEDDLGTVYQNLLDCSCKLLLDNLKNILSGDLEAQEQDETLTCYANKWERQDETLNWEEDATTCLRRIKACSPIPGARAYYLSEGESAEARSIKDLEPKNLAKSLVKVFAAKVVPNQNYKEGQPGDIVELNRGEIVIRCGGESFLSLEKLQLPGKKAHPVAEILKSDKFSLQGKFLF